MTMPFSNTSKIMGILFVAAIIISALLFVQNLFTNHSGTSPADYKTPPPAKGMPATAKEEITLSVPLKIYPKKEAVKKLKLPPVIAEDPAKHVTATAALKPSPGGYTVAAVTNVSTGTTDIISRESPLPLFALGGESEIGAFGGISSHGNTAVIFGRQDLLRIRSAHVFGAGAVGIIGQDIGYGVFAGVSARW